MYMCGEGIVSHDLRHGEAEATELVAAKKSLGSRRWMLHPDWPKKEAHFLLSHAIKLL